MESVRRAFSDPASKIFVIWHNLIASIIFITCFTLVVESVPSLQNKTQIILNYIEYFAVFMFTLDYLGNLFFSPKGFRYAFTVWGIIDLLAILPTFLLLLNLPFLKGGRVLRLLRVARVLRVLKLARMTIKDQPSHNPIVTNLKIYFLIFFSVMIISSTLMYTVEGSLYAPDVIAAGQAALQSENLEQIYQPTDPITGDVIPEDKRFFTSIPVAMWWCIVTLTSTGYGDLYPVTVGGRIVAGVTMFLGLALFGILLNVIGKTLMVVLFGEKLSE